ncbi:hypothetical protein ABIA36_000930 [Leifsonia sp. EB34]
MVSLRQTYVSFQPKNGAAIRADRSGPVAPQGVAVGTGVGVGVGVSVG